MARKQNKTHPWKQPWSLKEQLRQEDDLAEWETELDYLPVEKDKDIVKHFTAIKAITDVEDRFDV